MKNSLSTARAAASSPKRVCDALLKAAGDNRYRYRCLVWVMNTGTLSNVNFHAGSWNNDVGFSRTLPEEHRVPFRHEQLPLLFLHTILCI